MAVEWGQAQAAVIGSGLIDAGCVPLILAEMRPEDFNGACLRFFEAFRDLTAEQTPIDPVVVLARIGPDYRETAKALMDATPTSANVQAYIKACKEQSRLRLLREAGGALAASVTLAEAREQLQKAAEVSLDDARNQTVSGAELAAAWINAVNDQSKPEFITCGIGCLDSAIHTKRGNYHVIAGYTSHGKSAIALQMAWNMAQAGRRVGYFSFEMPEEDFRPRTVSMISGVDLEHCILRDLDRDEMTATGRAASELFKSTFFFEPASGMTVNDIRAKVLRNSYDVVFLDYLQLIQTPTQQKFGRYQAVSEISRDLQTMAHKLGIVVFAMSQLSRGEDSNQWIPVPPLSSLRESGQIEQDADAVIIVHGPLRFQFPRFRVVDIAKNRSGRTDRFFMDFDVKKQRFGAPSPLDYQIWAEMMKNKRPLKKDELDAIRAEHEADVKRQLEKEQRKRHDAERRGENYTQTTMEEVKS